MDLTREEERRLHLGVNADLAGRLVECRHRCALLEAEVAHLRRLVLSMGHRIERQSELLGRAAERDRLRRIEVEDTDDALTRCEERLRRLRGEREAACGEGSHV